MAEDSDNIHDFEAKGHRGRFLWDGSSCSGGLILWASTMWFPTRPVQRWSQESAYQNRWQIEAQHRAGGKSCGMLHPAPACMRAMLGGLRWICPIVADYVTTLAVIGIFVLVVAAGRSKGGK